MHSAVLLAADGLGAKTRQLDVRSTASVEVEAIREIAIRANNRVFQLGDIAKVSPVAEAPAVIMVRPDLAATAVWGSQQTNLFPGATVDGVFSIWYGKGPGVDRSMDVLKHGNAAGTSPHGGVIALAGDDHGCQSSTLPHQSEQVFSAAMIPVVNPATVQEYLDFGILGFALSRYSGCWVGFKAISETVESGASVWVDPERIQIVLPTDFQLPPGGLGIRNPDPPLEAEKRLTDRRWTPCAPSCASTASTGR